MTKICRTCEDFPRNYFKIIADSYFGSTGIIEQILDLGVRFTLCCRRDRKSYIFKDSLHKIVKEGEWISCIIEFNLSRKRVNNRFGFSKTTLLFRKYMNLSPNNKNIILDEKILLGEQTGNLINNTSEKNLDGVKIREKKRRGCN
ncbi:hypothetical protein M0812_19779 [Anaeramoeba flamelloides]|uniref:Transposase IS701-like DDE domain-containing protein n=1 Tax=Anaeramoeba flamelloides TaxID=1746091 RepID=A0AAV7Z070_9EUKA|nr:hypothetical protein M0812_19779 [Anaeramoeba flamelloides]